MGIFKRIWNWLCSLFGGRGSGEREVDRYVSEMQEALRNMRAKTEAVMAAQDKRHRELAQCREQMIKMVRYAEKALNQGDEQNARFFLEKKVVLERQLADLEKKSEAAAGYTAQAEELQQKTEAQLAEITARRDEVKAKMAAAELARSMSDLENSSWNRTLQAQADEAQRALDKAEALAELEERATDGDLTALMRKYDQAEESKGSGQRDQAGM
ncbi:MAG: PspA/IM30 family protein [Lachnospiraceae bacterium]|nr:PspA/IM30 family protein [Lachnospiraceae bacterium]